MKVNFRVKENILTTALLSILVLISIFLVTISIIDRTYFGLIKEYTNDLVTLFLPDSEDTSDEFAIRYINEYSKFSLTLPADWQVEEEVLENDYINFVLSSPDGNTIIQNTPMKEKQYRSNNDNKPDIPVGDYMAIRNSSWVGEKYLDILGIYETGYYSDTFYIITNGKNIENDPTLQSILQSFEFTEAKPPITDFISYTLPVGWIETYDKNYNYISIISDNLTYLHEEAVINPVTSGSSIVINKQLRNPGYTFDSLVAFNENTHLGKVDFIDTINIDNSLALYTLGTYEGTRINVRTIVENDLWDITITCSSCTTVEEYTNGEDKPVIDQFLQSIQFHYD